MLQTIGGDCDTAVGGLAEIKNNNLKLKSSTFSDNGEESFEHELTGKDLMLSFIGKSVAEKLLKWQEKNLKKMNILITRPLIDIEDLMGKLFSLGHKIIHVPTLKISSANLIQLILKNIMHLYSQVLMQLKI